jgi:hypothetical protein
MSGANDDGSRGAWNGHDVPAGTARDHCVIQQQQQQQQQRAPLQQLAGPTKHLPACVGVGERGQNPLAGVRLLPPAGCAVVGALLRCPLPLDLLRSFGIRTSSFSVLC